MNENKYFQNVLDWFKKQQSGISNNQKDIHKRDNEDTPDDTSLDENLDTEMISKIEALGTTMFISVRQSDLKRTTSSELKQFEKDQLFDKAEALLSTPQSFLTEPNTKVTHQKEVDYEEAVSGTENEPEELTENNDEDNLGVPDFSGDPVAQDEENEKIVSKAQAMAAAEVVTEELDNPSNLFALADQLLSDTTKLSLFTNQLCVNYTVTPTPIKKEDTICEVVTQSQTIKPTTQKVSTKENSIKATLSTNKNPTTKANPITTTILSIKTNLSTKDILSTKTNPPTPGPTQATKQTNRPKREKSTHMWEKFDWGPTRKKKELNQETNTEQPESTQLFDTTCELCDNELSDTTSAHLKTSKGTISETTYKSSTGLPSTLKDEIQETMNSPSTILPPTSKDEIQETMNNTTTILPPTSKEKIEETINNSPTILPPTSKDEIQEIINNSSTILPQNLKDEIQETINNPSTLSGPTLKDEIQETINNPSTVLPLTSKGQIPENITKPSLMLTTEVSKNDQTEEPPSTDTQSVINSESPNNTSAGKQENSPTIVAGSNNIVNDTSKKISSEYAEISTKLSEEPSANFQGITDVGKNVNITQNVSESTESFDLDGNTNIQTESPENLATESGEVSKKDLTKQEDSGETINKSSKNLTTESVNISDIVSKELISKSDFSESGDVSKKKLTKEEDSTETITAWSKNMTSDLENFSDNISNANISEDAFSRSINQKVTAAETSESAPTSEDLTETARVASKDEFNKLRVSGETFTNLSERFTTVIKNTTEIFSPPTELSEKEFSAIRRSTEATNKSPKNVIGSESLTGMPTELFTAISEISYNKAFSKPEIDTAALNNFPTEFDNFNKTSTKIFKSSSENPISSKDITVEISSESFENYSVNTQPIISEIISKQYSSKNPHITKLMQKPHIYKHASDLETPSSLHTSLIKKITSLNQVADVTKKNPNITRKPSLSSISARSNNSNTKNLKTTEDTCKKFEMEEIDTSKSSKISKTETSHFESKAQTDPEKTPKTFDDSYYNIIDNKTPSKDVTKNAGTASMFLGKTTIVEHLNGLAIIPRTKQEIEGIRAGRHHFTRVIHDRIFYDEDEEVAGATKIFKLAYKSGILEVTSITSEDINVTNDSTISPAQTEITTEPANINQTTSEETTEGLYISTATDTQTNTTNISSTLLELSETTTGLTNNNIQTSALLSDSSLPCELCESEKEFDATTTEVKFGNAAQLSQIDSQSESSKLTGTLEFSTKKSEKTSTELDKIGSYSESSNLKRTSDFSTEDLKNAEDSLRTSSTLETYQVTDSNTVSETSTQLSKIESQSESLKPNETSLFSTERSEQTSTPRLGKIDSSIESSKSKITTGFSTQKLKHTENSSENSSTLETSKATDFNKASEASTQLSNTGTQAKSSKLAKVSASKKESKKTKQSTKTNPSLLTSKVTDSKTSVANYDTQAQTQTYNGSTASNYLPKVSSSSVQVPSKISLSVITPAKKDVTKLCEEGNQKATKEYNDKKSSVITPAIKGLTKLSEQDNKKATNEYYDKESSEKYTGTIHYTRVLEELTIFDENDYIVAVKNISRLIYADKKRRRETPKVPINVSYEMNRDNIVDGTDQTIETWDATERIVQRETTFKSTVKSSNNDVATLNASNTISGNTPKSSTESEIPSVITICRLREPRDTTTTTEVTNPVTAETSLNLASDQVTSLKTDSNSKTLSESSKSLSLVASDLTTLGLTNSMGTTESLSDKSSSVESSKLSSKNVISETTSDISSSKKSTIISTGNINSGATTLNPEFGSKTVSQSSKSLSSVPSELTTLGLTNSIGTTESLSDKASTTVSLKSVSETISHSNNSTTTLSLTNSIGTAKSSSNTASSVESFKLSSKNVISETASDINTFKKSTIISTGSINSNVTSSVQNTEVSKTTTENASMSATTSSMNSIALSTVAIGSDKTHSGTASKNVTSDTASDINSSKKSTITSTGSINSDATSVVQNTESSKTTTENASTSTTTSSISSTALSTETIGSDKIDSGTDSSFEGSLPCELCDDETKSTSTATTAKA